MAGRRVNVYLWPNRTDRPAFSANLTERRAHTIVHRDAAAPTPDAVAVSTSSDPESIEAQWPTLSPRLLLYAGRLHRQSLGRFPSAPDPYDLVHDALTDYLTGNRVRPEGVDLFVFLCGVIRSKASNFLDRQQRLDGSARFGRFVPDDAPAARRIETPAPDGSGHLRDQVRALVDDDPFLLRFVELLFDDPDLKPGDLAALLDCSATEVYAARKRLDRRVASLRDALAA